MACEDEVKKGAVDGVVLGVFVGALLGTLECLVALLFARNDERTNFGGRILANSIQCGIVGLILGTVVPLVKGPCMVNMKNGMVDGMFFGMLVGALYGAVQVYRSEDRSNAQKAAVDIADWSVHVAAVCALVGALIALARGI